MGLCYFRGNHLKNSVIRKYHRARWMDIKIHFGKKDGSVFFCFYKNGTPWENYINFQFWSVVLANIFSLIACHPLFQIPLPACIYLLLRPFFVIPEKFISFQFNFLIVFQGFWTKKKCVLNE